MKSLQGALGLLVWCAGLALAQAPAALEAVGRIKTLQGQATIQTRAQTSAVVVGTPVFPGSVIQTGENASLGLTFQDGTVLALGADTRLTVEAYLYNPNQGQYQFGAQLGKGTLNYLSGAIAKHRPEAVTVKTPTAVIGVRGTHFVLKTEDSQ